MGFGYIVEHQMILDLYFFISVSQGLGVETNSLEKKKGFFIVFSKYLYIFEIMQYII